MKVYAKCKECNDEIVFSTYTTNRVELAMKEGDYKKLDCPTCDAKNRTPIDDIYTKKSNLVDWIGVIIIFVGTVVAVLLIFPVLYKTSNPFGVYVTSATLLLPGVIYGLLKKQDRDRVSNFNRNNVKGRVHNIGR